jgi:glycosyltransferase involved in cell wall biosynthesis
MSKSLPKVSVLMSVYNGSRYLQESIDSILNQTFTDLEFIIINDCSNDNSWEILNKYANKDERIVLINNPENIGLTKSLNKGLKVAKGEYIARQDADDISHPERLAKQVSLLDSDTEAVLVSCELELIDSEGYSLGEAQKAFSKLLRWYLLFYNRLAGHSQVMFRRELVVNMGGYCESFRYSQDYELWGRIVRVGNIVILPEILLQQRRHNQSITLTKRSEQEAYAFTVIQQNISKLIGKEISLEEAKTLRDFWQVNPRLQLSPDSINKVRNIHKRIKEIYRAFVFEESQKKNYHNKIARELSMIVGNTFVFWLYQLDNQLMAKIIVFLYALYWHPLGGLKYVLRSIKNLLLRNIPSVLLWRRGDHTTRISEN